MARKFSLLLAAAALSTAAGAQAADDRPTPAPPPGFGDICAVFGPGFHNLPGTESCIRISGRVRVDAVLTDGRGRSADDDNLTTRSRGAASFDARTETDLGLFRSYIEVEKDIGRSD
jgi:hypothetical protein